MRAWERPFRAARTRNALVAPDLTEKWSAQPELPTTATALGADGTIYYGWGAWDTPYTLAAWKSDGSGSWWTTPGFVARRAGVAIGADGTLVAALDDKSEGVGIKLLSPLDGSILALAELPYTWTSLSASAIGPDGTVYIGSDQASGKLHAFGAPPSGP